MDVLEKAELKRITKADLETILNWRNKDSIRKMMYTSRLISPDEHVKWFQQLQNNSSSRSLLFYYENRPYGVVNINRINPDNLTCDWGFYIGEQTAPKGLGTILGYKALEYIFEKLQIRKVSAEVLDYNEASIRFHRKLGFIEEGCLHEHVSKDGVYHDVILMGMFTRNWSTQSAVLREELEGRFL